MPDRCHASRDPDVARLSDRQADRERRERTLLDRGITAALDTLVTSVGQEMDVQVLVVATYGDPFAADPQHPERGHSAPVHAHFASLREDRPINEEQRRYLALEGVRSVSSQLRDELAVALAFLDRMEDLQQRADGGDEEAERRQRTILGALADETSTSKGDDPPPRTTAS